MQKVLITKKIPQLASDILKEKFSVEVFSGDQMTREELRDAVQKYDAILSSTLDFFDKDILGSSTQTKAISNYAVGLDNIDLDSAKANGISVYNLPDVVTESTADLTFAIFLALIRKIPQAIKYVRQDQWKTWVPNLFAGEELNRKTFGIWGLGRTGKAVAKRALGFGMKVVFYHYKSISVPEELSGKVEAVSLEDLLTSSDYISLHIPLNDQTRGLINLDLLKKMKKNPVLINMARGAVVNTNDLVMALNNGFIRGAALDVTDPEPISGSHPLCHMDNCIIVPHIGTETVECRNEMAKQAARNLFNHFYH